MSERDRSILIEKLLTEAENDGRRDGLRIGLSACQRIAGRYEVNRRLKSPLSGIILNVLAEEEIEEIKSKIRKAVNAAYDLTLPTT